MTTNTTTTDLPLTDSFVRNSYISPRSPEDMLFVAHDGGPITARLDGYAVIPIEEYRALRPDWRSV